MPMKDIEARRAYSRRYMQQARDKAMAVCTEAKDVPCADCGGRWPAPVMEFHHHADDKDFTIGDYVKGISGSTQALNKLRAEIAKCVVLCANCHRMRHLSLKADTRRAS